MPPQKNTKRRPVKQKLRIRPYAPILAMVVLFVGVLVFSLFRTMYEADAVDSERTRQAVAAAVQGEVDQIVIMADDNGIWDDAAVGVYAPQIDQAFAWSSWGISSAESKNYDTTMIVDRAGRSLLAYRKGKMVRVDPAALYGKPLQSLFNRLDRTHTPVGGIAKTANGLVLLGISDILPTSRPRDSLIPKTGAYRLIFAKPFGRETAEEIGKSLQITNASLVSGEGADTRITLNDAAGAPVGELGWTPSHPGAEAIKRALPWILCGAILYFIFAFYVVRQMLQSIKRLMQQAMSDSLSGLPNRRAMRRELSARLRRKEKVTLALIDLDGFKGINDNYGHGVGDRLIKQVSELLIKLTGNEAMVARLGGDEFAVMVTGNLSIHACERISRELLATLSQPFHIDERTVLVGASIGLASAGIAELDAGELLRRADVAMYAAKRSGKMRIVWYDEFLDQRQANAHSIEMELRAAIESEDFTIVYQPVVDVMDRRIISVEALLRWTSPTRGEVIPNEFIPIAEETGLIDRIGMIVLRKVCRDGLAWPDVTVSVNVSAAQLRNPEFSKRLSDVLSETGFPANRLELEITETYLVYDPDTARKILKEVQALGVCVALDDFGTGYASIGFLRQFAFNKLKIDRSLVNEAGNSEAARTVVQASIAVARALNMSVAAEGVETDAQADMMRVVGCDQLQGWLFSRAVDASEISGWVAPTKKARQKKTR
jgi:diguanylate cyclase (GGDEF)-like protein